MQGEKQQDSHEWYLHIIDKLHECEKPTYDRQGECRCFIHKAFFGRTRQEITCNKCGFVSRTQEQMLYLTLDFPKQLTTRKKGEADSGGPPVIPSMAACLEELTGLENLSDDSYSCRGCDKKGRMTKTMRIRKLPAILCMQVNRFQNEVRGGNVVQKKIKGRVQYPLEIDMRPYTTKGGKKSKPTADDAADDKAKGRRMTDAKDDGAKDDLPDGDRFLYDLESVIVHEGKAIEQGHYFAFCRGATLNAPPSSTASTTTTTTTTPSPPAKREWYMFNDAKVTVAAEPLVLEQEAYLLFYSLKRVCGGATTAGARKDKEKERD
jgi:ubiquitin carboxyl-terminal hydrolase 22/27/51